MGLYHLDGAPSHEDHIYVPVEITAERGVENIYAFLYGLTLCHVAQETH